MATEYNDNFTVKDFEIGDNIELHPATDAWMQGDRFGMVSKLGVKYVHVLMDKSNKTLKMLPKDIGKWNVTLTEVQEEINEYNEFVFGGNQYLPLPKVRPEPKPSNRFKVQGKTISTRSSNPALRKIAKRLAKKVSK